MSLRALPVVVVGACLSACSLSTDPGGSRSIHVRIGGTSRDPALDFTPERILSTPQIPPSSSSGFSCLGVNIMGPGIPSTGGNPTDYGNLDAFLNGTSMCAYPGVTTRGLPASSASNLNVTLRVPTGPSRIIEVVGVMDPTNVVCNSGQPLGQAQDDSSTNYFDLGHVITGIFNDTAIAVPDMFDGLSSTDQAARSIKCDNGGSSPSAPTYQSVVLATGGISAYWPLRETTGGTFSNIITGSVFPSSLGAIGGVGLGNPGPVHDSTSASVYFDGTSAALSANTNLSLGSSPNATFSMEAWVKLPSGCTSLTPLVMLRGNAGFPSVALQCTSLGEAQFYLNDTVTGASVSFSGTPITDGQWHHLVGTTNGGSMSLYVDGSSSPATISTGFSSGSFNFSTTPPDTFTIAYDNSGTYANVYVSEVAFYSIPLTAAQVQSHYFAK